MVRVDAPSINVSSNAQAGQQVGQMHSYIMKSGMSRGNRRLTVNRLSIGNESCDKLHPNPLCNQLRQKMDLPV